MMSQRSFLAFVLIAVLAVLPRPAHAYLDPGTGSIILQAMLGGVAGLAMVLKLYWHRLTSIFRRKDSDNDRQRPQT